MKLVISPVTKPSIDLNLEGVRGLAALLVAFSHLWALDVFWPKDSINPWLRYSEAGHAAVLVFFVLSGYVIGLTNNLPVTPTRIRDYFSRRALRLLPIYWLALLITFLVAAFLGTGTGSYAATAVLLQNLDGYFGWKPLPPSINQALWSLNYEVVYYALFAFLWRKPEWHGRSMLVALVVALAGMLFPSVPQFLAGYAAGWLFWASGWWLAHQPQSTHATAGTPMLATVFLLIGTYDLKCGDLLAGYFHLSPFRGFVNFTNLNLLPCCLLLVGGAAHRNFWGAKLCLIVTYVLPVGTVLMLLFLGRLTEFGFWMVGAGYVGLALLVTPVRAVGWLKNFASFGRISYAFYVLHMPLLYFFGALGLQVAMPLQFAGVALLWFASVTGLAMFFEFWLQPRIRAHWPGRSNPFPA